MKKFFALVAIVIFSELATAPGADAAHEAADAAFKRTDKDGDGRVTPQELPRPALFKHFDGNGDGSITLEETRAAFPRLQNAAANDSTPSEPPRTVRTSGPLIEKPGDVGVGRQLPAATYRTIEGKPGQLGETPMVVAMTSTTCPVSLRYAPSLARLEKDLAAKKIALVLVNPFGSEKDEAIRQAVTDMKFGGDYVHDTGKTLAGILGARTTTEVFLIDSRRTLIYRGALDDQYGVDYSLDAPRATYLRDAVDAMLAGSRPEIAATTPPGCELDIDPPAIATATALTWHRDISRILQQNCVECHHADGIAPFALDDFAEVDDRVKVIRRVIEEGTMPPWSAAPPAEGQPSPWANDRSLSPRDKSDLLAWLAAKDRPMGDLADAPAPRVFPKDGWMHGEPDAVFTFEKPVAIKAEGKMPYVTVTLPTKTTEEKWVTGFEILPGAREVVHHAIVFAVDPSTPGERFSETGGFFALYVPGTSAQIFPPGLAKRLPAGATLRFQMHYTPNGKATTDITRIGFHYATEPPQYEVQVASVPNPRIAIPAGADNHRETAERPAPGDMTILGFLPHMHLRGKAFRYETLGPDGQATTLLDVPRYDFNWQLYYRLKEPLFLPRGTRLRATAWYDNSAGNQANPDPAKLVKWGPQSEDEMMIGYLEYFTPVHPKAVAAEP